MNPDEFRNSPTGRVVRTPQGYWSFIPNPLPPAIEYDSQSVALLSDADRGLGELAGIGQLLPNPHLLIGPYIRREAVLSSRIEGTQASLSDLFYFEAADEEPPRAPDLQEVRNYVLAMEYGIKRVRRLPLSLRLVREIHARLMRGVRGEHRRPGEFRQMQNWIGPPGCTLNEATFVPPPVGEMNEALGRWERFLHEVNQIPPLIQCALMHYQFEAIHPFLDGNGRVGRLLITFFLCQRGHLRQPLLYLSAFFERHRDEYYNRLLEVSKSGDWVGWIRFFLRGIATQASDAVRNADQIISLHRRYREQLQMRKASATTLAVIDQLFLNPYVTVARLSERLNVSYPTVQGIINRLAGDGIVREITGRHWRRVYCAEALLRILEGEPTRRTQQRSNQTRP